jgi:hypothetical protein
MRNAECRMRNAESKERLAVQLLQGNEFPVSGPPVVGKTPKRAIR